MSDDLRSLVRSYIEDDDYIHKQNSALKPLRPRHKERKTSLIQLMRKQEIEEVELSSHGGGKLKLVKCSKFVKPTGRDNIVAALANGLGRDEDAAERLYQAVFENETEETYSLRRIRPKTKQ